MATGLQNSWSATPASNASADAGINLAEGQSPGTLNDAARGVMARAKAYANDNAGSILTAGTFTFPMKMTPK